MITIGFNLANSLFYTINMKDQVIENFQFRSKPYETNDFLVVTDIKTHSHFSNKIIYLMDKPFHNMNHKEKLGFCEAVLHPKTHYILGYDGSLGYDDDCIIPKTRELISSLCFNSSHIPKFKYLQLSKLISSNFNLQGSNVAILGKPQDTGQIEKITKVLSEKGSVGYKIVSNSKLADIIISGEDQFSEDIPAIYAYSGKLYRGFFNDPILQYDMVDSRFHIPKDIKFMINRSQPLTETEVDYFDTVIQESRDVYKSFEKTPRLAGNCENILERTIIDLICSEEIK